MNLSVSNPRTLRGEEFDANLFSGIFLRWGALTRSEKVSCLCIILIPLWWLWGWSYLMALLGLGLISHEFITKGKLELKRPSILVIAFLVHLVYGLLTNVFYGMYNPGALSTRDFIGVINSSSAALILWYIQSHQIRVRMSVIAWAFSVVLLQMLVMWLYICVVMGEPPNPSPPRSLFGVLTRKPLQFQPGLGNSNYLMGYISQDGSLFGMARYLYFFHGPESAALFAAFICLLSLDLRSKLWTALMFSGAFFILLTTGTRSVWIVLPIVIFVRFLLTSTQSKGAWIVFGLIGLSSFLLFATPSITDSVVDLFFSTKEAVSEFRADSTDVRGQIYEETYKAFINSPPMQLFWGHVETGKTVLPGYAPAVIGSHSFYLGTLLYIRGVVGTAVFLTFWSSLIMWLWNTRTGRPTTPFMTILMFSIVFVVMAYESVVTPLLLVIVLMYMPTARFPSLNASLNSYYSTYE